MPRSKRTFGLIVGATVAVLLALMGPELYAQGRMITTTGVVFVRGIIGGLPLTLDNIITTSTDGLLLQNTTAAVVGVPVQYSPRLRFCGTAWKTDATTASQIDCTAVELRPVSAAGATTSILSFLTSINGGSYTQRLSVGSDGTLTASGNIVTSAGNVTMGGAASVGWSTVGFLTGGSATGLFLLRNVTVTTGVGLDVATDAILKIRDRALAAYATVDALAYQASGTAITSGTTFLSSGSGMAVANVGANSCGTSAATIAGNNNANVTTVGATAGTQCRIAFTVTAATEWDCAANDDTTTVAVRTTPVDTTHTDLIGTFTAGDKISAICFPR